MDLKDFIVRIDTLVIFNLERPFETLLGHLCLNHRRRQIVSNGRGFGRLRDAIMLSWLLYVLT
jgi:hypothetical protein